MRTCWGFTMAWFNRLSCPRLCLIVQFRLFVPTQPSDCRSTASCSTRNCIGAATSSSTLKFSFLKLSARAWKTFSMTCSPNDGKTNSSKFNASDINFKCSVQLFSLHKWILCGKIWQILVFDKLANVRTRHPLYLKSWDQMTLFKQISIIFYVFNSNTY